MAARLTRAKAKLARLGPQLDLPDDATVDARLPAVATVVYLAATLGHTAGTGEALADDDLLDRAQATQPGCCTGCGRRRRSSPGCSPWSC